MLGCSIQDALQAAARAAAAAMAAPSQTAAEAETESEPAPVEAAQTQTVSVDNTPPVGASSDSNSIVKPSAKLPLRDNPSDAEVSKWLKDITSKGITITPVADLEGQTLDYWKAKAAITVKRMMEPYRGFSVTLSREASMQFDNFRDRYLIPMLGKILYHDPEAVKAIIGEDAAILLDNSEPPAKPVIDTNTQLLTELKWRGKTWAPAAEPRFSGHFGNSSDLEKRKE